MATVTHPYHSSQPDSGDPSQVSSDEWNANHTVSIAHSETTGQTVDDHHARDHEARHAFGGADDLLTSNFSAGTQAARPGAGTAGRYYFATDTGRLYRDNGSTWALVAATALADMTSRAHSDLTGIGIDDHHARDHSVVGATHSGFPADATKYLDGSGAFSVPFGGNPAGTSWTEIRKGSDQTVNNSTTLVQDSALSFAATSGTMFEFELFIVYDDSVGGTADLKYALGEDATATRGVHAGFGFFTTTDTVTGSGNPTATSNTTAAAGVGTATAKRGLRLLGWHLGNGGTFALWFAQVTAGASNTNVRAGSRLWYRAVA